MATNSDADFFSDDNDNNGWDDAMELVYQYEPIEVSNDVFIKKQTNGHKSKTLTLKQREDKIKILVHGYCHSVQDLLSNCTIPNTIINICIKYYHFNILWNLNRDQNNTNTRIYTLSSLPNYNGSKLVIINQCISKKLCDVFEFKVRINKVIDSVNILFGFIKANSRYNYLSRWISFNGDKYDEQYNSLDPPYNLPRAIKTGDIIAMKMDFIDNKCSFYWNDKLLLYYYIEPCAIYPGISCYDKGSEYEIIDYRLLHKFRGYVFIDQLQRFVTFQENAL